MISYFFDRYNEIKIQKPELILCHIKRTEDKKTCNTIYSIVSKTEEEGKERDSH